MYHRGAHTHTVRTVPANIAYTTGTMEWLSFGARASTYGVVVDIGSGSVGASIVRFDRTSAQPEVLSTHREFMPLRGSENPEDRIRHMRHALFTVMLALSQRGAARMRAQGVRAPLTRLFVSCTAPWAYTATQMIHFERKEPFAVTKELVDSIVAHAAQKEEATAGDPHLVFSKLGMQMVERSVVDVMVNGYTVSEPYGKAATELDVAHLRGLVPTAVVTALSEVQRNILSDVPLAVRTSALVLYCVFRDVYPDLKHALIVEVSGEATECSLMRNEILYETTSISRGMHTLTREVATQFKVIPEEARTYLRSYKQDALTKQQETKLGEVNARYAAALESALANLRERYPLPRTVFLLIDQPMQPFFTEALQGALAKVGGGDDRVIRPITPMQAERFARFAEGTTPDPRLAITARFFHKLHACGEIDN